MLRFYSGNPCPYRVRGAIGRFCNRHVAGIDFSRVRGLSGLHFDPYCTQLCSLAAGAISEMNNSTDPHQLLRFSEAQSSAYQTALDELQRGSKRTHWIWYIFPQVEGLGSSITARHFAIRSRAEAIAYISDPMLGGRLRECTQAVLEHKDRSAHLIFGSPDDLKFLSSMTLFELASGEPLFAAAIDRFYGGRRDSKTLAIWSEWAEATS